MEPDTVETMAWKEEDLEAGPSSRAPRVWPTPLERLVLGIYTVVGLGLVLQQGLASYREAWPLDVLTGWTAASLSVYAVYQGLILAWTLGPRSYYTSAIGWHCINLINLGTLSYYHLLSRALPVHALLPLGLCLGVCLQTRIAS